MASKPQSPWVKPSMGIPGHLAAHNTVSSTVPDLDVTGECIPKQVLRKRGRQGSRGHLTCLSVEPGTCSSDCPLPLPPRAHCLSGACLWPCPKDQWEIVKGSFSDLSSQRELGEQSHGKLVCLLTHQIVANYLLSVRLHCELGIP